LSFVSATSVALGPRPDAPLVSTASHIAHLEGGRHLHTVTLVATPAATAQSPPGVYRLRAVVHVPPWHLAGWHGRAVSAPISVAVRARDDGKEGLGVLEQRRLTYAAKYYLSVGQPAEARRLAEELRALRANDPATLILLGDISAAESKPDRARSEYRRALSLLPHHYEQPALLLERIARASERTR
jgi:tetratricopeptide (TPR) repeat protein